jgi:hypothetical protein
MFQAGELVEYSTRYTNACGMVRYHSSTTDKVFIDLDDGQSIYVEATFVTSITL